MKYLCNICLLIVLSISVHSYADREKIFHIKLEGMIHNVSADFVENSIEKANREGSALIILQINTPGGYSDSMERIIRSIMSSPTPIAVYIGPSGAKAASAGFFIAIAADIVIMAPGTNTGAAHPALVPIIPISPPAEPEDDQDKEADKKTKAKGQQEILQEKVLKDSIAYIKSLANARGRNEKLAIAAVEESSSYTAEEALNGRLVEFISSSVDEIVRKLDGYEVKRLNGSIVKLDLKGRIIEEIDMSWKDRFLSAIANPTLIFLFLIIAAIGIYAEFTHPGTILPGAVGFVSLILFFFAAQILPINIVGVLLIIMAVVLFILEFKITSYGMLTIGGCICMVLGGLLLIDSPLPELRVPILSIIPIVAAAAIIVSFLTYLVIRSHRKKVTTGSEGLVGETAIVEADIDPEGKVFLQGEIWNAISSDKIKKGQKVIVDKVEGMFLHVRKKI